VRKIKHSGSANDSTSGCDGTKEGVHVFSTSTVLAQGNVADHQCIYSPDSEPMKHLRLLRQLLNQTHTQSRPYSEVGEEVTDAISMTEMSGMGLLNRIHQEAGVPLCLNDITGSYNGYSGDLHSGSE
jgi:hypothetical protein